MRVDHETGTRPRIRHLTSVHEADDSRILHRECASLARAGHDVAIVAAFPPVEPVEHVPLVLVGEPRNRLDRMLRVAWRVFRAARRERADVCQLHDPELLWIGLLLKLVGARVVYDVHEDLPKQIADKTWIPRRARGALALAATLGEGAFAAAVADGVVAATPSIAARFPGDKTVVVQNFPSAQIARTGAPGLPWEDRPYAFAYTGGLTAVQGIREITTVAGLLAPALKGVVAGWFDDDGGRARDPRRVSGGGLSTTSGGSPRTP